MARRWFTSDFHIGMQDILRFENRPFKTIEKMNEALKRTCIQRAKVLYSKQLLLDSNRSPILDKDGNKIEIDVPVNKDLIYHLGDLFSYKNDRGNEGASFKPNEFLKDIPATFVNIRGNHDLNNKVKSVCNSMSIYLNSRYPNVALNHYPTNDPRCDKACYSSPIVLHGHVHRRFKHLLDLDHNILNVNVGVDAWNYQIISEDEVVEYLNSLFKKNANELFRCKTVNGKMQYIGKNDF